MPVLIAACALAFTVASFWWIQVRRGRLIAYEPQTYSGYIKHDGFRLRLPLTIYNTGARALVVTDLRASFPDLHRIAPAITLRASLKPAPADTVDFIHPFVVPARSAVTHFVEFGSRGWVPDLGTAHRLCVHVRTGDDGAWREMLTTMVTTASGRDASAYITHRRDPADEAPEPGTWEN